jgi:hypothetical protein
VCICCQLGSLAGWVAYFGNRSKGLAERDLQEFVNSHEVG